MGFKESTILATKIIFILGFQTLVLAEKNKLTFCRVDSLPSNWLPPSSCPYIINSKSTDLKCIPGSDRIACLRLLLHNQADFMVAQPEDLKVVGMSKVHNDKFLVTQEFRPTKRSSTFFKWVVVVRKNIENINHLEKRRYCAPDAEAILYSDYHQKYFENKLIIPECNPSKTLLENRMSALSRFFDNACISTAWTHDYNLDTKLKKKYDNLCSLCSNSQNCTIAKTYLNKEYTTMCLHNQQGDIGWFSLSSFKTFYEVVKIGKEEKEYQFLCPNGTTMNLESNLTESNSCIWFHQPKKTIISRKEVAESVTKFITEQTNEKGDFNKILQSDEGKLKLTTTITSLINFTTPADYLKTFPAYYYSKEHTQCELDRKVKWCVTTNLEAQKCKWLSYAAQSYGVEPFIECVQEKSPENCVESVKNGSSDIFAVKPHEELEARKKGLKPVIHMVSTKHHGDEIAAIVGRLTKLTSLEDLKDVKACFASYRDAGWNSFVYVMGDLTGNKDWYCNDKEMVSQFFKATCVFDLEERNGTFPENLYSYCSKFKNVEGTKEQKVMSCVNLDFDVVFVNLSLHMQHFPDTLGQSYTKPLCINGSTSDTEEEDKCYSAWKTVGSLMVHEKISQVREDEIYLMLMDLDKLFGERYQGPTPLISLYQPFDGVSDVIFSGDTQHLERKVCPIRCSLNYQKLLQDLEIQRQLCNGANSSGKQVFEIQPQLYNGANSPGKQVFEIQRQLYNGANSPGKQVYFITVLLLTYLLTILF